MDDKTVVITGANGQVGRALQKVYPQALALDRKQLNITDQKAINEFNWDNVKAIINAAAWTDVDGAENPSNYDLAKATNVDATSYLATAANQHDLTFVTFSSDYVFDGSQPIHNEDEIFSPLNIYGKTKADGDLAAITATKHYIIRTSWVIGELRDRKSVV